MRLNKKRKRVEWSEPSSLETTSLFSFTSLFFFTAFHVSPYLSPFSTPPSNFFFLSLWTKFHSSTYNLALYLPILASLNLHSFSHKPNQQFFFLQLLSRFWSGTHHQKAFQSTPTSQVSFSPSTFIFISHLNLKCKKLSCICSVLNLQTLSWYSQVFFFRIRSVI